MSINAVLKKIKKELDTDLKEGTNKKVSMLYACNASGKTRLSRLFNDQFKKKILYYNAFTEDLFSWDNDNHALKFGIDTWVSQTIQDLGLERQIIENFQKFTGSKIEPSFDIPGGQVTFGIHSGDGSNVENIKISRGEESVFIWSFFYTILEEAIGILNMNIGDRLTKRFDNIQYILIDDPVSSMDDTRIITIALELVKLITKSETQLKFLITTHHALFFNVLFNEGKRNREWDKKNYVLSKSDTEIYLKIQGNASPFAYHHTIISEIKRAIKKRDIRRYHFNLFRSILEKTANFLGYASKNQCLEKIKKEENKDGLGVFQKTLEHYSHNSLWDLEPNNVDETQQVAFEQTFNAFIQEFKWGKELND